MELIQRYVQEVGSYLPRRIQVDVERQLELDLERALQDRRASGVHGSEEEAEIALLDELGPPHQLAESYLPQPNVLFGPRLYPAFFRTLAIAFGALAGLILLGLLIDFGRSGSLIGLGLGLLGSVDDFLKGALVILGLVVVVFAALERTGARPAATRESWDPRTLAPLESLDRVSPAGQVAQVAFLTLALVLLNLFPERIGAFLSVGDESGWVPLLGEGFRSRLWLLDLCLILDLALALVVLRARRWRTSLRWLKFGVDALYVGWLAALITGPPILEADAEWMIRHGWSPEAAAHYAERMHRFLTPLSRIGLRLGLLAAVVGLMIRLVKLIRMTVSRPKPARPDRSRGSAGL
jgi:hypothetical protein